MSLNAAMTHLKQFWFLHSAWILSFAHFMIPSVNNYIDKHPHEAMSGIATLVIARLVQGPAMAAKPGA